MSRHRAVTGPGFDGMCHAVIEEKAGPLSADDAFRLAAVDATMLRDRISAAGDPVESTALANALLAVVQEYLERTSNEYDLELFLEVNGRRPEDLASWPVTILAGLRLRRTPSDEYRAICERAVEIAVRRGRSAAPS